MLEEAASGALRNFNETLIGSVLVCYVALSFLAFRYLNGIITSLKADLEKERIGHDATRAEQLKDIRSLAEVANSVESLTRSVDQMKTELGRTRQ